jgi:uncharacterized tellurite resistance protein B-like protein
MDLRQLYAEIGKLLYAVADVDGMISSKEKESLHKLIQSRLTQRETHTDEFGTNDAWYAEFEFDVAEEQIMSSEEAFASFLEYVREHQKDFDPQMRDICLTLASRMAESYRHSNRKELALLRQLKEALYTDQPLNRILHDKSIPPRDEE